MPRKLKYGSVYSRSKRIALPVLVSTNWNLIYKEVVSSDWRAAPRNGIDETTEGKCLTFHDTIFLA